MRSPSLDTRQRLGFTLLELLVVVAIIALLISILLPALQGARDQSQQLLCNTNLKSMGEASYFYAEANHDYIIRGEADRERVHFVMSLLKGLTYDGSIYGLWYRRRQQPILDACRSIRQLQCPRFPDPRQPLDYIVSAFPLPYTQNNIDRDDFGPPGDDPHGEAQNQFDRVIFFRSTTLDRVNPGRVVYLTEAHAKIWTNNVGLHDIFAASQLPFGVYPRTSNDRRHPGGINALFFDGHAETMPFHQMDAGWPNPIGIRLHWFTVMPDDYEEPGG